MTTYVATISHPWGKVKATTRHILEAQTEDAARAEAAGWAKCYVNPSAPVGLRPDGLMEYERGTVSEFREASQELLDSLKGLDYSR